MMKRCVDEEACPLATLAVASRQLRYDMINNTYSSLEAYIDELTPYLGEQEVLEAIIKAIGNLETDRPPQQF
jgi:hypothetical protein